MIFKRFSKSLQDHQLGWGIGTAVAWLVVAALQLPSMAEGNGNFGVHLATLVLAIVSSGLSAVRAVLARREARKSEVEELHAA